MNIYKCFKYYSLLVVLLINGCTGNDYHDYPISNVPAENVILTDNLWAPSIDRNLEVTLPYVVNKLTAGGSYTGSGISKVIEGIAYYLMVNDNDELEALADTLISHIKASQMDDGDFGRPGSNADLSSLPDSLRWLGTDDFGETGGSPKLYGYGHLYEAAVEYYLATGKKTLLEVAEKNADLLLSVFGPGKLEAYPFHPEIELALVKLYRVTGKREYLDLSKFFLDSRGPNGTEYSQSHLKIVDQDEATGHAVRALYLYSGITDIVALEGSSDYRNAIDKIWNSVVDSKLYITGGLGAYADHEAFGEPYSLPNLTAYNETCASIAGIFWSNRMFLLEGDAAYVDVMERTLYNSLLAGISISGDRFFYPNPLASYSEYMRASWYGVPCCPTNVVRFMPQVPGYVYATKGNNLYVNLFINSTGSVEMPGGKATITQETAYPWQGGVRLRVETEGNNSITLRIRIPGWASGKPVPSDLYYFQESPAGETSLTINGEKVKYRIEDGYAVIRRNWKPGDIVEMDFPMEVHKIKAEARVKDNAGRFAMQRGPIVYCLEGWDNPGGNVHNLVIPDDATFSEVSNAWLPTGIYSLETTGKAYIEEEDGTVRAEEQVIKAIPYYLWANRGPAGMEVWIPREESAVEPLPFKPATIASLSRVSSSFDTLTLRFINDQEIIPYNQNIPMMRYYRWPLNDTATWVRYDFAVAQSISSTSVYWYDNEPSRMTTWYDGYPYTCCRVPESWKVYYLDNNGSWRPVVQAGEYGIIKDRYNQVKFEPVTTKAVKMVVKRTGSCAAGIQEWIIN